jgi:hypothetical protein
MSGHKKQEICHLLGEVYELQKKLDALEREKILNDELIRELIERNKVIEGFSKFPDDYNQ